MLGEAGVVCPSAISGELALCLAERIVLDGSRLDVETHQAQGHSRRHQLLLGPVMQIALDRHVVVGAGPS
ncbi:hypothetical protein AB0C77_16050 [Streptomyces sp. NPDC048629]|uniref:hypothetical protein n=1 Tax=Streptomyces sp. NPDC048629 TaxID=3154824 RepID=UPI0034169035